MENIEELLNQDDILSRVHLFELVREEGKIYISIREPLCSVSIIEPLGSLSNVKFIAIPSLIVKDCSNNEYCGFGDSEEEALKNCLKKIKGVPINQIIPTPKRKGK